MKNAERVGVLMPSAAGAPLVIFGVLVSGLILDYYYFSIDESQKIMGMLLIYQGVYFDQLFCFYPSTITLPPHQQEKFQSCSTSQLAKKNLPTHWLIQK